jgi:molybdate transport system regulatory protein
MPRPHEPHAPPSRRPGNGSARQRRALRHSRAGDSAGGHGASAARTAQEQLAALLGAHVAPALKGWLLWDGEFVMGPRYIRLLEGIERHGNIRAACADLGLSYRTCLTRIRRMERVTRAAIVVTQRGGATRGGAEITPLARRLVRAYRAWRDEMERTSRHAFTRAVREQSGGLSRGG